MVCVKSVFSIFLFYVIKIETLRENSKILNVNIALKLGKCICIVYLHTISLIKSYIENILLIQFGARLLSVEIDLQLTLAYSCTMQARMVRTIAAIDYRCLS